MPENACHDQIIFPAKTLTSDLSPEHAWQACTEIHRYCRHNKYYWKGSVRSLRHKLTRSIAHANILARVIKVRKRRNVWDEPFYSASAQPKHTKNWRYSHELILSSEISWLTWCTCRSMWIKCVRVTQLKRPSIVCNTDPIGDPWILKILRHKTLRSVLQVTTSRN